MLHWDECRLSSCHVCSYDTNFVKACFSFSYRHMKMIRHKVAEVACEVVLILPDLSSMKVGLVSGPLYAYIVSSNIPSDGLAVENIR